MDSIEELREMFSQFPGIGGRQAKRFVYFLLLQNESFVKRFLELVSKIRRETDRCISCLKLSSDLDSNKICLICSDGKRDSSKLMVVAKDIDLENIEKSGFYNGKYFVLGGLLPILEKNPEEKIRLRELAKHVELLDKNLADLPSSSPEIIVALSANTEGDYTCDYLRNYLTPLLKKFNLKISFLGRGLSTGTELEYSDGDTIRNALKNRQ